MIGICKPMPRVSGDVYRCAFLKRVRRIVQCENSATFQNVEAFVHLQMSMNRNARAQCHLLGSQPDIVGASGGANLDKNVAMVAKMNEMLTFRCGQHISRWSRRLGRALRQYLAESEGPQAE